MDVANAVAKQAESDLTAAYNQAVGLAPNQNLTGQDLGGLTLLPGVYFFSSVAQLTGTLTLNDQGNPDAIFVFQIGSTLTTAANSSVQTINDPNSASGISVFWQVGSSATLETGTAFEGNILALTSITAGNGATVLDGRLLAINGAVTLDDNTITAPPAEVSGGSGGGAGVPDTGSTLLLLGAGLASLAAFRTRFSCVA
jgi:type VI secretion system secreted protein VgrG